MPVVLRVTYYKHYERYYSEIYSSYDNEENDEIIAGRIKYPCYTRGSQSKYYSQGFMCELKLGS